MAAAPWIVSDELWSRIEPLLPRVEQRFRYPGRKQLPDRQALQFKRLLVRYDRRADIHEASSRSRAALSASRGCRRL
jgi:transposase